MQTDTYSSEHIAHEIIDILTRDPGGKGCMQLVAAQRQFGSTRLCDFRKGFIYALRKDWIKSGSGWLCVVVQPRQEQDEVDEEQGLAHSVEPESLDKPR